MIEVRRDMISASSIVFARLSGILARKDCFPRGLEYNPPLQRQEERSRMSIWKTKTPAQIEEAAEHTQLKKNLTAVDLAALGIGSVVGTGIFVATGQGAQLAGPGILLSFIIAAVTCGFCALPYSELACMFPVARSNYSYSYVAFGEVIAWIIGWGLTLE